MDRSLDDIIKSKQIQPPLRKRLGSQNGKLQNPPTRKPFVLKTTNRIQTHQNGKAPVSDARHKIIAKARSTVVDARMKITQKDARLKLNSGRISKPRDLRGKLNLRTRPSPVSRPIGIIQRTVQSSGLRYRELDIPPVTVPLQRTIRNNFTAPYVGGGGGMLRPSVLSHLDMEWSDLDSPIRPDSIIRPDPLLYHASSSSSDLYYNPMDIPLSTRTVRNDLLHHEPVSSLSRSGLSSSHMLSSHLQSRLDTDEPRPRTMGILGLSSSSQGVLRQQSSSQQSASTTQPGHRIVVSNLKDSVNSDDIKELFEDIGPLIASRVVRPGTAEVIYAHQKDAIKAVETYHNRQLDKQPMKCMLVIARASTNPLVPAVSKLPQATKTNTVQPDLAVVHKALFNKHSLMYK